MDLVERLFEHLSGMEASAGEEGTAAQQNGLQDQQPQMPLESPQGIHHHHAEAEAVGESRPPPSPTSPSQTGLCIP